MPWFTGTIKGTDADLLAAYNDKAIRPFHGELTFRERQLCPGSGAIATVGDPHPGAIDALCSLCGEWVATTRPPGVIPLSVVIPEHTALHLTW